MDDYKEETATRPNDMNRDYKEETMTRPSDMFLDKGKLYVRNDEVWPGISRQPFEKLSDKYRGTKPRANQMISFKGWFLRDVCGLSDVVVSRMCEVLRDNFDE